MYVHAIGANNGRPLQQRSQVVTQRQREDTLLRDSTCYTALKGKEDPHDKQNMSGSCLLRSAY